MKKILLFIISFALILGFVKTDEVDSVIANAAPSIGKERYTFLICGIDDAAENTDAIVLFSYDTVNNDASFVQIPRDTYLRADCGVDKINSVYPTLRSRGADEKSAMNVVADEISRAIGIRIDGYICYTVGALARLIDAIGGVEIDIPSDMTFADVDGKNAMNLSAGRHLLDGRSAVRFIRYRKGYALGDLGRVDAQKFFLSAFVNRLKHSVNLRVVSKAAFASDDGMITNIKIMDILGIALKIRGRIESANVRYASIPGEARPSGDGRWYYLVNKKATKEMIDTLELPSGGFDAEGRFMYSHGGELQQIYYNTNIRCKIYDDDTLNDLSIR